jgi:hypothetical protein
VVRTTHFSRYLDEYVGRSVAGQHVPDELVVSFQRLLSPAAPELCRRVARRCLAVDEAVQRGLPRQDAEVLVERWRDAHDLKRDGVFQAWLDERCLSADELALALGDRDLEERLLAVYAARYPASTDPSELFARIEQDVARRVGTRVEALTSPLWMRPGIHWSAPLVRELKLRAELRPALALAGEILQHNVAFFEANPCLRLSRIRRGLVSEFFAHRWAIRASKLDEAILERGFVGYGQFLEPAARVFIYERTRQVQWSHGDPSYWFHTSG